MRLFLAAPLLALAATPAEAQRIDPRLGAALDCVKVTDQAQRLACYDKAMVPLSEAAASGALERRTLGPRGMQGAIAAMRSQGPSRMIIQLDNGDRWALVLEGNDRLPGTGDQVTVRRGVLGNWWVDVKKGQTFQARFLGPPEAKR